MLAPAKIRQDMVRMIAKSNGFHIAPNLSTIEIIYTLFFRVMNIDPTEPDAPDRDRFLLSKGHCAAAAYTVMAARGFFDAAALQEYNLEGSPFPSIADSNSAAGLEMSSGSIGRGPSVGLGMALVAKREEMPFHTYVLIGDGECQEGSIWEAVMLAPGLGLDNLTVIVDNNGLQGSSTIADVMDARNYAERFSAFGWEAHDVEGHDIDALEEALRAPQSGPKAVIAHTVKGKGLSMMEHEVGWHYRALTFSELVTAMRELR
ncbi:transketolase [Streptomyces silvisoli]|uniref:Transketolase n=1 Tax=Streptomyces silvisoli TaxID=3034235 RepID=A0ABT5ZKH4_9ACTN|nr:transketolase [Streptomyces silvisoli]MDF3290302.1 transketolase [Streptomyces silvisoli]